MAVRRIAARRVVALALMAALFTTVLPTVSAEAATANSIRDELKNRINGAREARGLRTLRYSSLVCPAALLNKECMQDFAQGHARKMGNKIGLEHDSGTRLWREVPVGAWWRAENVAFATTNYGAKYIHRKFMDSSGHRANILNARATHVAIGVYKADGAWWVVERFADMKPLP